MPGARGFTERFAGRDGFARFAGLTCFAGFVGFAILQIGKRNFWFEAKNTYVTRVTDADGLRIGSAVTIAGLRVGEVSALAVEDDITILPKLRAPGGGLGPSPRRARRLPVPRAAATQQGLV